MGTLFEQKTKIFTHFYLRPLLTLPEDELREPPLERTEEPELLRVEVPEERTPEERFDEDEPLKLLVVFEDSLRWILPVLLVVLPLLLVLDILVVVLLLLGEALSCLDEDLSVGRLYCSVRVFSIDDGFE